VTADLQINNENLKITHIFAANEIKYNQTSSIFLVIARNPEMRIVTNTSNCFLKFKVVEVAGDTVQAQYDDEYQIEDVSNWCMQ
jgi:hypothetical protein